MTMTTRGIVNPLQNAPMHSPEWEAARMAEPGHRSFVERQNQATREAAVTLQIKTTYPKWDTQPIKIRMQHGAIVEVGFENGLAAICAGRAELVQPGEVLVRNVPPHLANLETR